MAEPTNTKRHAGKKLGIVAAIMAVIATVFWIDSLDGNILGFRFWKWHQKLTITMTTPSGTKSAYAVTKVAWEMPPPWFRLGDSGGGHGAGSLEGEAVALEFAEDKYLFVLLSNYPASLALQVFAEPPLKSEHRGEFARTLNRINSIRATRNLNPEQYPALVTFGDRSNPASVRSVDPLHLDASFGSGYALDSITMTITDEPVTEGQVKRILPWLDWSREKLLALGGGENPVRFKRGELTFFFDRSSFTIAE
jgi:hypothetical protein